MSALDTAWQAALAAEHQAVFGYPVLGPKLSGAEQQLAVACSNAHEDLRDATEAALVAAGSPPVAPQADYPALYPVGDAAAARRLAVRLEEDCAAAWRYLYAQAATSGAAQAATSGGAQAATSGRAQAATSGRAQAATSGRAQAATSGGAQAGRLRTSAQTALTASAVRAAQWRRIIDPAHVTTAFPGI